MFANRGSLGIGKSSRIRKSLLRICKDLVYSFQVDLTSQIFSKALLYEILLEIVVLVSRTN